MCGSACHAAGGWLHANPLLLTAGMVGMALTLYRLLVRGRWPAIVALVIGWVTAAVLILWVLP